MTTASPPYKFRRGATIRVALEAVSGDPLTVTGITAEMRPRLNDGTLKPDGEISCTAVYYPPSGNYAPGWHVTATAVQSAALEPGEYGITAALSIGADVIITDPAPIWLED
jgi:hypothetical protein